MHSTSYPGPESIFRHVLENGITVLVYENPTSESFVIEGLVRAGALVDTREKAGVASFASEMLTRGTARRTFEEIYEQIESVGASLDFGAGRHLTEFSGSGLAEDLDLIMDLLAESLRVPVFPTSQLEPVRGEIITGLQIRSNDTRFRAAQEFRKLLYGEHPYSQLVDGYPDSLPLISREDLVEYHNSYYGPQGMIITLVGSVDAHKALDGVSAAFGDWRNSGGVMPPSSEPYSLGSVKRSFVEMPDKFQSDILLGVQGPRRSEVDYLEASLANTVLGVFGMMGRLGKKVREEQGLAYYAYSQLHGGLGPSPWSVSTGVAPQNVDKAIDSLISEIDRLLNEPIPVEELEDSKAYRTGSLPVGLETNDGIASVITDMELFELGLDYLHTLPEKIMAMTPETVQAAARRYLNTDKLAIAVAGPGVLNELN